MASNRDLKVAIWKKSGEMDEVARPHSCAPVIPSLQAFVARRAPASSFALEAYFCQGCYHQAGARALFHSQSNYGKIQTIHLLFHL